MRPDSGCKALNEVEKPGHAGCAALLSKARCPWPSAPPRTNSVSLGRPVGGVSSSNIEPARFKAFSERPADSARLKLQVLHGNTAPQ
jgi:hypothetical protein